jgi:hypothetical protein
VSQRKFQAIAYPLEDKNTEENIRSRHNQGFKRVKAFQDYITTDSYVDSLILDARLFNRKVFSLKNKHPSNALKWNLLACIDPRNWHILVADSVLNNATSTYTKDSDGWAFYKLQVKANSSGNQALIDAWMSEVSP